MNKHLAGQHDQKKHGGNIMVGISVTGTPLLGKAAGIETLKNPDASFITFSNSSLQVVCDKNRSQVFGAEKVTSSDELDDAVTYAKLVGQIKGSRNLLIALWYQDLFPVVIHHDLSVIPKDLKIDPSVFFNFKEEFSKAARARSSFITEEAINKAAERLRSEYEFTSGKLTRFQDLNVYGKYCVRRAIDKDVVMFYKPLV